MNDWNGIYVCHLFNRGLWCCSRNWWFLLDMFWTLVLVDSFKWKWTYILYWILDLEDGMCSKWVLRTSRLQECKRTIFLKSGGRATISGRGGIGQWRDPCDYEGPLVPRASRLALTELQGHGYYWGSWESNNEEQTVTTTCDYLHWHCAHQVTTTLESLQRTWCVEVWSGKATHHNYNLLQKWRVLPSQRRVGILKVNLLTGNPSALA